jgi:hypothetical protein
MQKRRSHCHNNNASSLPLTETDLKNASTGTVLSYTSSSSNASFQPKQIRRRKFKGKRSRDFQNRALGCAVVASTGLLIVMSFMYVLFGSTATSTGDDGGLFSQSHQRRRQQKRSEPLPLSHFKSLQYPLQHAKLVGLYFAASWCRFSTPVTENLDTYFGDIILAPIKDGEEIDDDDTNNGNAGIMTQHQAPLAIVHVSSDKSEERFRHYMRKNWIPVPFNSPEQTALKRHFSVCAKPEIEELGIHRKYEIPTLLIIDSKTHGVLTTNGAEDLEEYGAKALDHWMELHDLVRAMEDKYSGGEDEEQGYIQSMNRRIVNNNIGDASAVLSSLFGPN